MKIIKKEDIKNKVKYIISSEEQFWIQAQENSFKILAKQLKVHGFRAGHIPTLIAKKHISEQEIMNHALKRAIDHNYKLLIDDKDFNPEEVIEDAVSIDLSKVKPKELEIIYIFEKYPTVTLTGYDKIKIDYEEPKVEKNEIDSEIERYTKKDIMLIPKEEEIIAHGDMVNFDFKGFVNDEPFAGGEAKGHELEIGSKAFIPGFEEQMIGLKKGEKKTIEITFPKNYHTKHLADKKAKFELIINDIKTIQKPHLDETYIARFAIPNVKTPEQFRKYISEQILDYKKYHNKEKATRQISTWLITNTKLSYVPQSLLDSEIKRLREDVQKKATQTNLSLEEYVNTHLGYKTQNDFEKALKESADKNLHLVIGIEKIIDDLKIDTTEADLNNHLEKMARAYAISVDQIKQKLNNNFDGIKTFILQEKMFDKLIEINKSNK